MKQKLKAAWKIWALSLGERASENIEEADKVAAIRTFVALINVATCILISANILISWHN